jgi:hypothetical protein
VDPPLILVGPAVSSAGPDAWDANGASTWLDYFLGNFTLVDGCDPSNVEYIAMHDYKGSLAELQSR